MAQMQMEAIKETLKEYLLRKVFSEQDRAKLTDSTSLLTGKLLDSVDILDLVCFVEETFQIQIEGHEVDVESLDTISAISALIRSKLPTGS